MHYRDLLQIDAEAAKKFREDNSHDERFETLMQLHDEMVPAMCAQKDFYLSRTNAAMQEEDPEIRAALLESARIEMAARTSDLMNANKLKRKENDQHNDS